MLVTTACQVVGPNENVGFGYIRGIDDVVGVYKNRGEVPEGQTYAIYLTQFIWPTESLSFHSDIDAVELMKIGDKKLVARALQNGTEKKESAFIEGVDFSFHSGRIRLSTKSKAGVSAKDGAAMVVYQTAELGIDRNGDGKYRVSNGAFGVIELFVFLPPGIGEMKYDVRFTKIFGPSGRQLAARSQIAQVGAVVLSPNEDGWALMERKPLGISFTKTYSNYQEVGIAMTNLFRIDGYETDYDQFLINAVKKRKNLDGVNESTLVTKIEGRSDVNNIPCIRYLSRGEYIVDTSTSETYSVDLVFTVGIICAHTFSRNVAFQTEFSFKTKDKKLPAEFSRLENEFARDVVFQSAGVR